MSLAFVKATNNQSPGDVSSLTATFSGSTVTGNLIVVCVGVYVGAGTDVTFTVTDNKGNSYATCTGTRNVDTTGGNEPVIEMFYAKNITGGASHVVTVTPSASCYMNLSVQEISGADTTAPFDKGATSQGSSTTPSSGNTATTTQANEILVGMVNFPDATNSPVAGSGFTEPSGAECAGGEQSSEYQIVSATGAYAATWTCTSARWRCSIATFKEAAGGGGGRTVLNTRAWPLGMDVGMGWRMGGGV